MFYSEGSTRTVESVVACAKAWADFPCAKIAEGEQPDCVKPGSKALGEPCLYPSQCSSLSCSASGGSCGKCTASVGVGQACGQDVGCTGLLACDLDTSKCQPWVRRTPGLGDACPGDYTCARGLYCDTSTKCAPLPKVGEPCGKGVFCDYEHAQYCRSDLTCQPEPGPGMPCGENYEQVRVCNLQISACDLQAGGGPMCVALPKLGEPCASHQCGTGLFCDATTPEEIGVCRARLAKGAACTDSINCETGLLCDQGKCQLHVAPEEPCTADGTHCHVNSLCDGKVCAPLPALGNFAKACQQ
jgi:hypothetical protein